MSMYANTVNRHNKLHIRKVCEREMERLGSSSRNRIELYTYTKPSIGSSTALALAPAAGTTDRPSSSSQQSHYITFKWNENYIDKHNASAYEIDKSNKSTILLCDFWVCSYNFFAVVFFSIFFALSLSSSYCHSIENEESNVDDKIEKRQEIHTEFDLLLAILLLCHC